MTPTTMKRIAYLFISILIIIAIYPIVSSSFYSQKFTEMAILGPKGNIGEYPHQVHLDEEFLLNIFIENHEKQTKLFKVVIKLVENSTLNENSPPFAEDPISSYIMVLGDEKNTTNPVNVVIDQHFNGKLVAELYMFNIAANSYVYHDRWVAIWMKTMDY
ncbi:MAG: DUF1616 domain-containing protein [Candidatus Hodarchaeales archaeon]